jgi:hypothetical protein
MPRECWFKLGDTAKQLWDRLDDKDKAIILGFPQDGGDQPSSSPPSRRANLHEMSAYDFIQAQLHEVQAVALDDAEEFHDAQDKEVANDDPADTVLINSAKSSSKLQPGDIRRVMSNASKRHHGSGEKSGDPKGKLQASMHITYCVSAHRTRVTQSLVDRGANGGVAGEDVRIISKSHRQVDIQGINNHQVTDIGIGTVGGVVHTQHGPILAIMHQYALFGKGTSIHSPGQLEWYKNSVDDKSVHVGGTQSIKTLDGYLIPLSIKNGLPRMDIRPYTDAEWDMLPHVFLTSELEWDPSVLDHDHLDGDQWFDTLSDLDPNPNTNLFDEFGDYRHRVVVQSAEYFRRSSDHPLDNLIDQCVYHSKLLPPYDSLMHDLHTSASDDLAYPFYDAHEHVLNHHNEDTGEPPTMPVGPLISTTKEPDYSKLRPFFGWFSPTLIKKTFEHTTQYARIPMGTLLKRSFKSANPALNVSRRSEPVACDIMYADVPAIDNGATAATLFVGCRTAVTDVYGIKTDKQFVNTLEDNIRECGAPNKLISDRAQVEIGKKVQDILRTLFIGSWQSEPHQQQQNPAERRFQTVKNAANRVMDRTGAPAHTWLLCLAYVCFLLNHMWDDTLSGIPLTLLTGVTVDISVLLRFYFWQKVYYKREDYGFPSESKESVGYIVGISEHVGNALTWKILTADTQKVIYRSQVRPFHAADRNLRAELPGGEEDPTTKISDPIIKSRFDSGGDGESKQFSPKFDCDEIKVPDTFFEGTRTSAPIFDPQDLVGRTFLLDEQQDGQKFRAKIVKLLEDHESELQENPTRIKFLCSVNGDKAEEIITYNQMLDYISREEEDPIVWKFRWITAHQGPLTPDHPDYNGSRYNIMIEWENGEITSEPLTVIAADDPVTCAIYAKEKGLLNEPGWKRFKGIAKRQKKFTRMVNQAKLRSYNTAPKYKYGFEVPRDYKHAKRLDEKHGDNCWQDATDLELHQIDEYETFQDYGLKHKVKPPDGYKKIRVHLVFDVKHDGRHKARLVAGGHLTDPPLDSVYSGVVSLRGFR